MSKVIGFLKNHYGKLICLGFWIHFGIWLLLQLGEVQPSYIIDVPYSLQTLIVMAVFLYGAYSLLVKFDKYMDRKYSELVKEREDLKGQNNKKE